MSSHKSCFLRMEHARMGELERQLESARRESQDRAVEATKAWAVELLVVEWVTAVERGLNAVKAHEAALQKSLADTEVVLQRALETLDMEWKALESERKARSEADQEVLALWGRVMGTEEANARLCEQVTRQKEGLSILENTHLGKYLFCFQHVGFFL